MNTILTKEVLYKRLRDFPDICPICNNDLEDLSNTGLNPEQYKREVGKCFIFENGKTLDCLSTGLFNSLHR